MVSRFWLRALSGELPEPPHGDQSVCFYHFLGLAMRRPPLGILLVARTGF